VRIIPDPNRIKAVARGGDPETSWEAARDLNADPDALNENRKRVLNLLRTLGPSTDEWLIYCYPRYYPEHPQTEQSIRSRRNELRKLRLVRWTGDHGQSRHGKRMRIWEAV